MRQTETQTELADSLKIERLGFPEFQLALQDLSSRIANYDWMWTILRSRAKKHGGMFPERGYNFLKQFGNRQKPYFISTTSSGLKFVGDYRDLYSVLLVIDPTFNTNFVRFISSRLEKKTSSVYLDVGSNIGVVAAEVAKQQEGSQIFAFEPLLATAKLACATFALNGLKNVTLFPCAVSNEDALLPLYHTPGHSDVASLEETQDTSTMRHVTHVRSIRLDTLRSSFGGKIDLIKFDVEGHEPAAIGGAEMLIADDEPEIIYEYAPAVASKLGWTAEDIALQIGADREYEFFAMNDGGGLDDFALANRSNRMVNIFAKPKD